MLEREQMFLISEEAGMSLAVEVTVPRQKGGGHDALAE
jgi:hypothetical protein